MKVVKPSVMRKGDLWHFVEPKTLVFVVESHAFQPAPELAHYKHWKDLTAKYWTIGSVHFMPDGRVVHLRESYGASSYFGTGGVRLSRRS